MSYTPCSAHNAFFWGKRRASGRKALANMDSGLHLLLQERSGKGNSSGRRLDEGHGQDVVDHERVDGPGRAQDVLRE